MTVLRWLPEVGWMLSFPERCFAMADEAGAHCKFASSVVGALSFTLSFSAAAIHLVKRLALEHLARFGDEGLLRERAMPQRPDGRLEGAQRFAGVNYALYRKRLKQAFLLASIEYKLQNAQYVPPKQRELQRQALNRRRNSIMQGVTVDLPDSMKLAEDFG
ncbi:unnamed protein product [Effrenium voratum]|uniref:Uncharacterized protein n=1 Tax=Effrenium voratum TaxID=2562239 RepID=A0AA36I211_9DINO|nr:unnamed protein product [Effrenium voratum]